MGRFDAELEASPMNFAQGGMIRQTTADAPDSRTATERAEALAGMVEELASRLSEIACRLGGDFKSPLGKGQAAPTPMRTLMVSLDSGLRAASSAHESLFFIERTL